MADGHLRRGKPLWVEEWVGCCEKGTREAGRRKKGRNAVEWAAEEVVVSLSQWVMGARVLAGKF